MSKVIVKCYGTEKKYSSAMVAIKEFQLACFSCEGSGRDRYVNILAQLCCGKTYCSDEE